MSLPVEFVFILRTKELSQSLLSVWTMWYISHSQGGPSWQLTAIKLPTLCALWGVHQHYGVESSYVLDQTVFNVMYFIQADSHLWSHKTNYKELSKLGDWHFKDNMHSKAAYQSVSSCMASLLHIMPESIHLFTPQPLRFTLWQADFSGFFK